MFRSYFSKVIANCVRRRSTDMGRCSKRVIFLVVVAGYLSTRVYSQAREHKTWELNSKDPETNEILHQYEGFFLDLLHEDYLATLCHDAHIPSVDPRTNSDSRQASSCNALYTQIKLVKDSLPALTAGGADRAGAGWYWSVHEIYLSMQLDECAKLAVAGNEPAAKLCQREILNAHDFLFVHSLSKHNPPMTIWLMCGSSLEANLALGARCMIAAGDMQACAYYPDGRLADHAQCGQMLVNGGWTANPAAQRVDFSYKRNKAYEK